MDNGAVMQEEGAEVRNPSREIDFYAKPFNGIGQKFLPKEDLN